MLKLKDTGILTKDIKSTLTGEIIGNKDNLVLIDKWTNKTDIIITDTITKQSFKIESKNVEIDHPDITKNIRMPLLFNSGWIEKDLIKYVD